MQQTGREVLKFRDALIQNRELGWPRLGDPSLA
jgi:hypothetical protein